MKVIRQFFFCLAIALGVSSPVLSSTSATITGRVTDSQGLVVPGAQVQATNILTNISYVGETNQDGLYRITNLPPGEYRVIVQKQGFASIAKPGLELHVQDIITLNFSMQVGSVTQTIMVEGGTPLINTESAAVGTVVHRQFAENLPLNGRSFNTLFQLTPGVVITGGNGFAPGQFSISGQRNDANNITVDGVSANFGASTSPALGQSGLGSAPAVSAIGGTSSLVSVEALQEFRIETSSYAPEFGRSPGGQVTITTRSGTNDFHGGLYEYFRNDVFDANDWFANAAGRPQAPERHNDFGGFLGGPIWRNKTFFFTSYEGARLRLPQTRVIQVPSAFARSQASASLAPFLNAYPQPDDRSITPNVFTSPFTGVWSDSATLNAGSIRVDHTFNSRFAVFGRYNEAPSESVRRLNSLTQLSSSKVDTRTATFGLNTFLNSRMSNTFRANFSRQYSATIFSLDSFGGAVAPSRDLLLGSPSSPDDQAFVFITGIAAYGTGPSGRNTTTQLNFADDFSFLFGNHQTKYGVDYRVIYLNARPGLRLAQFLSSSVQSFLSSGGVVNLSGTTSAAARIRTQSLSLYAQDTWKLSRSMTLTYGVRWELAPAPAALGSTTLASWTNVDNPPQIALAPSRTPLWGTRYANFAPRIGMAYALTDRGDFVLRVGGGIFYDLGLGSSAALVAFFPNSANRFTPGVQLPISDLSPFLSALSLQPPFPSFLTKGFSPNLKTPRSYQWNLAVEKSFRGRQAITATYVGQAGRDLLREEALTRPNVNFLGNFLLTKNNAYSNYHALQLQYRGSLAPGLQALLNYSWSHSLDNASDDVVDALSDTIISAANDYASSSFDVRHSFSGALSYSVPSVVKTGPLSILVRDWSVDAVVVARAGFPFNAISVLTSPALGNAALSRPDRVPGQPLWIGDPSAPGGKSLNPAAFVVPSTVRQGTEGRNDIPGFGLTQVDLSVARKFPITERFNLQFRTDAFNLLNHPNFANPVGLLPVTIFGTTSLKSDRMLNQRLGLGGLNPLFGQGGPRSLQLSLKLTF